MGICPKVNVIARLEYELVYYDSAVHRFNHYTTRTHPCLRFSFKVNTAILNNFVCFFSFWISKNLFSDGNSNTTLLGLFCILKIIEFRKKLRNVSRLQLRLERLQWFAKFSLRYCKSKWNLNTPCIYSFFNLKKERKFFGKFCQFWL